jgi:hypothetical protein
LAFFVFFFLALPLLDIVDDALLGDLDSGLAGDFAGVVSVGLGLGLGLPPPKNERMSLTYVDGSVVCGRNGKRNEEGVGGARGGRRRRRAWTAGENSIAQRTVGGLCVAAETKAVNSSRSAEVQAATRW